MSTQPKSLVPTAGFVVKVVPGGEKHFVNVCSHDAVDRPLDASDREVGDQHLSELGVDNLRVPLLCGPVRTFVAGGEEAVVIDVVFSPAVLAVALPPPPADEDAPTNAERKTHAMARMVRHRLAELALKNAEEELGAGVKLGRDYTLPRNAKYRGAKAPVPMANLGLLAAQKAAAAKHAQLAEDPGPWRSSRKEVGLGARPAPKIVELDGAGGGGGGKPAVKKGFLNSSKAAGALYPGGSDEGMHPPNAGDPLGWMPAGLRSKVNVVDTSKMSKEEQERMMREHAEVGGGKGGGGKGGGGARAAATAAQSGEARRAAEELEEAARALMPSEEDVKKLAETSDPAEFMAELKKVQGMFDELSSAQPPPAVAARAAAAAKPPSDDAGFGGAPAVKKGFLNGGAKAAAAPAPPPAATAAAAAITEEPSYELAERDGAGGRELFLRVSLPTTDSLAAAELDVSNEGIRLIAGEYRLELRWPSTVDADAAKAKFVRKAKVLQVSAPLA